MTTEHERLLRATRRLAKARMIANALLHDDRLHRLAMLAVFVLEDAVFELHEIVFADVADTSPLRLN